MIYSGFLKVIIDKVLALLLLLALVPVILMLYLLLFGTQGNPIIFIQRRSGIDLKPFNLYKFRTLVPSETTNLSISRRNLTLMGNILRRSGLDEIPQLLNILKGDMSFIGPRPLPIEYNKLYQEAHLVRFKVKPGISGWAQVHGRNDISWHRRFELDAWYVNNITLFVDLKICYLTFIQLLSSLFRQNKKQMKMKVFNGSNLF